MISEVQQPLFIKQYQTPEARFHLLPPGIAADRRAPANAGEIRAEFRREFQLADDDLLLVQIGSGFKTKGLDRSLKALAALPRELKKRTRLIAIGQDDPKPFLLQVKALGLSDQVQILKGRSDIPRFLLGADLLVHPAYNENTGTVLLEAPSPACRCWSAQSAAMPTTSPRPKPGAWCRRRSSRKCSTACLPRCSPMTQRGLAGAPMAWPSPTRLTCIRCRSVRPT